MTAAQLVLLAAVATSALVCCMRCAWLAYDYLRPRWCTICGAPFTRKSSGGDFYLVCGHHCWTEAWRRWVLR